VLIVICKGVHAGLDMILVLLRVVGVILHQGQHVQILLVEAQWTVQGRGPALFRRTIRIVQDRCLSMSYVIRGLNVATKTAAWCID